MSEQSSEPAVPTATPNEADCDFCGGTGVDPGVEMDVANETLDPSECPCPSCNGTGQGS